MSEPFAPDWQVPPGETIREFMEENHLSTRSTALLLELHDVELEAILLGRDRITVKLAYRLKDTFGPSVEFWMALEANYRKARRNAP